MPGEKNLFEKRFFSLPAFFLPWMLRVKFSWCLNNAFPPLP
jgi:hypothetical protein